MNPSIRNKLEQLDLRLEEVGALLSDAAVIGKQDQFRQLSREYADLQPVVALYRDYRAAQAELDAARAMQGDTDAELRAMAENEVATLGARIQEIERRLQILLLPKDPNDNRNIFLEVRAGTGGDEAALFAGDLFRMYNAYAGRRGWQVEVLSASPGEHGGYKEIIARIVGPAPIRASSSNPAATACSACRPPRPRAASIPRPAPWR
jgi:peptide chain release factor 1